jgi:Rps23 Pro-64 3,4-dihydroxylase Tpa1-like proline 4-hydroxylase
MPMKVFERPPPCGVVHNWLGAAAVGRLLDYAILNRALFKESTVGHSEKLRFDPSQRRSATLREFGSLRSDLEAKIRDTLPAMFELLGSETFTPSKLELEMAAHGDGAFYALHKDTRTRQEDSTSHRVISAVYYFHAMPKAFSGGVLRLHSLGASGQPGTFIDVEPRNDTLAFFPSWFFHEILPVVSPDGRFEDSRFAINCWVHRAKDSNC